MASGLGDGLALTEGSPDYTSTRCRGQVRWSHHGPPQFGANCLVRLVEAPETGCRVVQTLPYRTAILPGAPPRLLVKPVASLNHRPHRRCGGWRSLRARLLKRCSSVLLCVQHHANTSEYRAGCAGLSPPPPPGGRSYPVLVPECGSSVIRHLLVHPGRAASCLGLGR